MQKCAAYKISNWDLYSLDDKLAVDFVGKFENLAEDLQKVQVRLSLPGELVLPHTKGKTRKDKRHYSELLNDKTRQRLDLACQREIELLDYGWERQ